MRFSDGEFTFFVQTSSVIINAKYSPREKKLTLLRKIQIRALSATVENWNAQRLNNQAVYLERDLMKHEGDKPTLSQEYLFTSLLRRNCLNLPSYYF